MAAVKILRIKLRNLNSLRGEHVIDFTKEPLASASIFAITGPTGAGKSTLLDAMTLALYGQAARYQNDRNPENMMSRHSSDCLAEVVFSVNQQQYRAEWQLRRANGKVDGRIQPPVRFLYDAQEIPLNRLATECTQQIERITGLDYQRFLRSVLLAQGEFSRFLKATADERAELLESLTGTAIYSELGMLAHSEYGRRDNAMALLRAELSHLILLSEEEITAKREHSKQLLAQWQEAQHALKQLRERLASGEDRRKAQGKKRELEELAADLGQQQQLALPDWEKLSLHLQAQPFSLSLYAHEQAQSTQLATRRAANEAQGKRQLALTHHAHLLTNARAFSQSAISRSEQKINQAQEEWTKSTTQAARVNEWMEKHQYLATWTDALPALSAQAHQVHRLHLQQAQQQTQIIAHESAIKSWHLQKQQVSTEETKAKQELDEQTQKREQLTQQRNELLLKHPSSQESELLHNLQQRQQQIQQLINITQQREQQQSSITTLETHLASLDRQLIDANAEETIAKEALSLAAKEWQLRRDHLSLAERFASLEEHRSMLRDQEECPLCGSKDHPLLSHPTTTVALQDLHAEVAQAESRYKQADAALVVIQKKIITYTTQQQSLAQQVLERKKTCTELFDQSKSLATTWDLSATSMHDLEQASDQNQQQIAKVETLLKSVQQAEQNHREALHRWQQATQKSTDISGRIEEIENLRMSAIADFELAKKQCETLSTALASALLPYQFSWPDFSQSELALDSWQKAANTYSRGLQTQSDLANLLDNQKKQIERDQQELAEWQTRHATWNELATGITTEQQTPSLTPSWQTHQDVETDYQQSKQNLARLEAELSLLEQQHAKNADDVTRQLAHLTAMIANSPFADIPALREAILPQSEESRITSHKAAWEKRHQECVTLLREIEQELQSMQNAPASDELPALKQTIEQTDQTAMAWQKELHLLEDQLTRDAAMRSDQARKTEELKTQEADLENWRILRALIGSHDGAKFRKFAQGISLDILTHHANLHLQHLSERYRMQRQKSGELTLEIIDLYQANSTRPMASLSGGESFLVSLALALGLSDLAGRNVQIDSLFIDEGFGSLDADALDAAISTLESLHQQNKTIGIISHIDLLKERITTKINIRRLSAGTSTLEVA